MEKLAISQSGDHFTRGGKPFFYLADTLWTAFSNISLDEWQEYLEYRQSQGFNAFQANVLTQWDGGKPDTGLYPFAVDAAGKFSFDALNEEYFARAARMVEMAAGMGFVPVLVLLWGNYVQDTWMSDQNPANIMPLQRVPAYIEYVARLFAPYNPVYIVSGDTNFGSERATETYMTAMRVVKQLYPDTLTTLHLGGGLSEIPDAFLHSGLYDFYMYQSSHNLESQDQAYKLAQDFYHKPVRRPVLNGEPCYEGHAFGGKYGRYNAFHVRKAVWQSLLSGGKAGVTYGAHGVWGWYREGKQFANEGYGGRPLPWRTGLKFKGAWDAAFARWIFETFALFDLEPAQNIINDTGEIRMSISPGASKVAIYAPYNSDIRLSGELTGYEWTLINLEEKIFARPVVKVKDGLTTIKMHDFNADVLLLGLRSPA